MDNRDRPPHHGLAAASAAADGWARYDSHGAQSPTDEEHDAMMGADWLTDAPPLPPLAGLADIARDAADSTAKLRTGVAPARAAA